MMTKGRKTHKKINELNTNLKSLHNFYDVNNIPAEGQWYKHAFHRHVFIVPHKKAGRCVKTVKRYQVFVKVRRKKIKTA